MPMLISVLLTFGLVATSVFIHYEVLRAVSRAIPGMPVRPRARLLAVIGAVFVAHMAEIILFALAFALLQYQWGLGAISGSTEGGWLDIFYFSASTYTTLGMGDLFPTGAMRFVAAIESLAGLVLIGWSASYTYLVMREFWDLHERRDG
jgi:hypothetical protein